MKKYACSGVLLLCMVALFGCGWDPLGQGKSDSRASEESSQRATDWILYTALLGPFFRPRDRVEFTDQRDGTVLLEVSFYTGIDPVGDPPAFRILIQKCPRGFLYNTGSNDCSLDPALGGSDPNLARLSFCDSDTNSCNDQDGILNGLGNSEMHGACAAETASGLTWRPIHSYALLQLMTRGDFASLYPDLDGRFVWVNRAFDTTTAFARSNTGGLEADLKSREHFVLCEHPIDGLYPVEPEED